MTTFDAQSTADSTANSATSINHANLTIGSGSNRAVVFPINFSNKAVSGVTVTWDNGGTNQACSQIITHNSTATNGRADLWGLTNPTSGNKTLHVAWTGTSDICVGGVAYSDADQTGGATTFKNANSGTGTPSGTGSVTVVAVTSATGDAVVGAITSTGTINSVGNTSVYRDGTPNLISGAAERAAGAATVNLTAAFANDGNPWVAVGVSIASFVAPTNTVDMNSQSIMVMP